MTRQAKRKRATKDQCLFTGLQVIALNGVNGLKVELPGRELGVACLTQMS
jgi:hypothetical protein